jgi:hypothetical protein
LPFPGLFPGSPVGPLRTVVGGELDPDPDPEETDGVAPDVEPLDPLETESEVEEVLRRDVVVVESDIINRSLGVVVGVVVVVVKM